MYLTYQVLSDRPSLSALDQCW